MSSRKDSSTIWVSLNRKTVGLFSTPAKRYSFLMSVRRRTQNWEGSFPTAVSRGTGSYLLWTPACGTAWWPPPGKVGTHRWRQRSWKDSVFRSRLCRWGACFLWADWWRAPHVLLQRMERIQNNSSDPSRIETSHTFNSINQNYIYIEREANLDALGGNNCDDLNESMETFSSEHIHTLKSFRPSYIFIKQMRFFFNKLHVWTWSCFFFLFFSRFSFSQVRKLFSVSPPF